MTPEHKAKISAAAKKRWAAARKENTIVAAKKARRKSKSAAYLRVLQQEPAPAPAPAPAPDVVNHPPHYTAGTVECIDYIEQVLGHEGFVAFLRGQCIRYNHRMMLKGNPSEDAGKLAWYANRLELVL
jgi:hypothetical protein